MAETLVCPNCLALNRVPSERLADGPRCGKCKAELFPGDPPSVSGAALAKTVVKSSVPVVVDFWAPWCGPCRTMAPAYAQAAKQLAGKALLLKVDTDAEQGAGAAHRIQSIPTLAVFRQGREVARTAGAMPPHAIVSWVNSALGG